MLNIENGSLSIIDNEIKSSDTVLTLRADVDCQIFGVLSFKNGEGKIVQFSKIGDEYKGRLLISSEELNKLNNSIFYIVMVSNDLKEQTNAIQFKFNLEAIKKDIRVIRTEEIKELKTEIEKLNSKFNSLEKNAVIKFKDGILNKDLIRQGMILVAADDQGNFVASYPFADIIKEVNGQKAVNGIVEVKASMIKCNSGKTLETVVNELSEAIQSIANALKVISDQQKDINQRINDVDIRLSQHLNDGII